MDFEEDLTAFFADFSVVATVDGVSRKVILDKPDVGLFDDAQVSHDFNIRYITSDFPNLHDGKAIVVNSTAYTIRGKPMLQSDGHISVANLRKSYD